MGCHVCHMGRTLPAADDVETYTDYRARIAFMAECVEEERDELAHEDTLADLVFDTVDSSRLVFIYANALRVLDAADTEPSEWKHLVADGDSHRDVIRAMAFDVVRADLWAELNERGVER